MKKNLLVILCFNFLFNQLFATRYYVDAVNGSNSFNGLTPATAFATLGKVSYTTTTLIGGDTVFVRNGTYGTADLANTQSSFAVLAITQSGTPAAPIVFKNYPGESPLIQFNNWHGIYLQAAYIVIDGFKIRGNSGVISLADATNQPSGCNDPTGSPMAKFNGNGITFDANGATLCHHIAVRNCEVYECCGAGIGGTKNDYITIENNKVYGNSFYTRYGTSGISLLHLTDYDANTSTNRNIIRNNVVYDNELKVPWYSGSCRGFTDGNGIIIDDANNGQSGGTNVIYYGKTLIENNVVYNNGGRGIHVFVSSNVTIINNTVYQNNKTSAISDGEITVVSTSNSQSSGNRVFNNVMMARTGKRLSSLNNQTSFTEGYNLMYNSGSIGYFTGTDIYANPVFTDPAAFNFTLQNTSPGIDAGSTASGQYSTTDILGISRPQGSGPDIGAYEFTGLLPTVATFTAGNLVALRAGDGSTVLSTNMADINLLEYTTAGASTGMNIVLGNTSSTAMNRLVVGGANNTYEGQLNLSTDGRYLAAIGYDVATGSTSTTALAADKVIARVSTNGQTDFSTRFSATGSFYYNGNNVRNVVTDNGGRYWVTGSGTANTRYITAGSTTISNNLSGGLRSLSIFNNRLYYAGAFADPGYCTPDLPTTSVTLTGMPSIGTTVSYQSILLFDLDPSVGFNSTAFDVMYLSDVSNGLRKYYWNGSAWTAAGIFNPVSVTGVTGGFYSITGKKDAGGNVVLYVIKGAASNNNLMQVTDASGYNGNISTTLPTTTTLVSAGANYMFRGIAFSPSQTVILPVYLQGFSGQLIDKDALLQWSTVTETNCKEFVIERGHDGRNYTAIGKVAATNRSIGAQYSYTDKSIGEGMFYYRLLSVDNDGKTAYSKVVLINTAKTGKSTITLFPNPVRETLTVAYPALQKQTSLLVIDMAGRQMMTQILATGSRQISINVSSLNSGQYSVVILGEDGVSVSKFVK